MLLEEVSYLMCWHKALFLLSVKTEEKNPVGSLKTC